MMRKWICIAIYSAYVLSVLLCAIGDPYYNWDLLGYIGCVVDYTEDDEQIIHAKTYNYVYRAIPSGAFTRLVAANEYRKRMVRNPAAFCSQLPFYHAKPLYVSLIFLLGKFGLGYLEAMRLISIGFSVLTALLIFRWALRYTSPELSVLFASALIWLIYLYESFHFFTPDVLSAFLILSAFYVLIVHRYRIAFMALLCFSVLGRLDNVLLVVIVLFVLAWQEEERTYLFGMTIAILIPLVTMSCVDLYGWWPTFCYNFIQPAQTLETPPFVFSLYADALWKAGIHELSQTRAAFVFLPLGMITFLRKRKTVFSHCVLAIILSSGLRFLLFPSLMNRFFIAQNLVIGCFLLFEGEENDVE